MMTIDWPSANGGGDVRAGQYHQSECVKTTTQNEGEQCGIGDRSGAHMAILHEGVITNLCPGHSKETPVTCRAGLVG
jgi:hypothetical protein